MILYFSPEIASSYSLPSSPWCIFSCALDNSLCCPSPRSTKLLLHKREVNGIWGLTPRPTSYPCTPALPTVFAMSTQERTMDRSLWMSMHSLGGTSQFWTDTPAHTPPLSVPLQFRWFLLHLNYGLQWMGEFVSFMSPWKGLTPFET